MLRETPRDVPRKTRGQDGFATSFPVGLLHPLQHAGLARRTPVCPSSAPDPKANPALPPRERFFAIYLMARLLVGSTSATGRIRRWHRGMRTIARRLISRLELP